MLPVFYEDQLVGHITRDKVGLTFAYSPEWLSQKNSFAISVSMPLREGEFENSVATPWFANLLPEERQLEVIGRLLGRSQGDVYGLLEKIGRETAGALSIGASESTNDAQYRKLDDVQLAQAIAQLPDRPLLIGEGGVTMSLAGAQSKLTVAVFDGNILLPLNGAASTHILKPASDRLHATVENELFCMHLAAHVGLPTASTTMATALDKKYLLVERYDRHLSADRKVHRDHQEDFCQALSIYPTNKHESGGGPGFANLFSVIDEHSKQRARDRLHLLDLIVFSCCVGDTDRHGKNYALMLTDDGPRLAPAYDLMTALIYQNITRNLAMKIADKSRAEHLHKRHWERFASSVGLSPSATPRRVNQIAEAVSSGAQRIATELSNRFQVNGESLRLISDSIQHNAERVARNSQRN